MLPGRKTTRGVIPYILVFTMARDPQKIFSLCLMRLPKRRKKKVVTDSILCTWE
jgi:hypothetical protein